ncbi:Long-chain acyl-CoA synthetase (AMP-forming) [Treponema sp. JC4]|uniref:AMP-dependent synthetase/ligase n=1 Tax=Treponema sp. JC4 TaxID=1124982 RepID=UPI00025B0BC1|nr:long-chain fatty acid--CoA ligase [Treponema sp. JC4]EID85937.1 Long-chain acyl-CoA synthetase (AMP-forming) [Treponema sp. JC4]
MKFTKRTLPKNLPLLLKARVAECPEVYLQAAKDKNGVYQYYTYAQFYDSVIAFAHALRSIGVKRGDNIALMSDNRREWFIMDYAILCLGAADVPRGCDSMGTEMRFITSFADCVTGVFENEKQLGKILEKIEEVPLLKTVILFDHMSQEGESRASEAGLTVFYFEDLMKKGLEIVGESPDAKKAEIEAEMEATSPDDVATMIFTSGTTGTPKGVMLTHNNYISQLSVIHDFITCKQGDWWMTILPVWHVFERLIQYVAVHMKCGLAYSKPAAPVLLPDMAVIRPQWICGVPRLWEALASGVIRTMKKTGGLTLKLFNFFIGAGSLYAKMRDYVFGNIPQFKKRCRLLDSIIGFIPWILLWPLHKLGDILVFRKIRAKMGGRINIAISGGGALQKDIDDFYRAIGLNLLEGYGMSETAPVVSFRDYRHPRPGVVGVIFPTMEVRIVAEEHGSIVSMEHLGPGRQGLIVLRSPQVMKGYYKRPDLTEKVLDRAGWLNTGDLGMMTLDNEIKITGRAKDTIVLLDGENVEPVIIESALLESNYIESIMVTGQDKKYLGALIVPVKDALIAFASENNLAYTSYENLLTLPEVTELIQGIINEKITAANGFRLCEKIFKFKLLPKSFEAGVELSAKLEMMRFRIAEIYKAEIDSLFE